MTESLTISHLIARNALFVCNHSGGKDSQALLAYLRQLVPASQILVIHAELPEVDWPGIVEQVLRDAVGLPVIITRATKTFFEMVEHRGFWPSPQQRQCTSDLKRGPIEREIRRYLKSHPEYRGLVVSCMGLRAGESASRAKRATLQFSRRNSKAGREWYDWLPIQGLHTLEVLGTIADHSPAPLHWAYQEGMSRLSCCFCIMASRQDLATAARLRPGLYRRYVETEGRLDQTLLMPVGKGERRGLEAVTGIMAEAA